MEKPKPIIDRLRELLGDKDCIQLLELTAGTRIFVSKPDTLGERFGDRIAEKLYEQFGREYLKVPLARQFRVEYYHSRGCSMAQIARLIGITEGGVDRILSRPRKSSRKAA